MNGEFFVEQDVSDGFDAEFAQDAKSEFGNVGARGIACNRVAEFGGPIAVAFDAHDAIFGDFAQGDFAVVFDGQNALCSR